MGEGQKKGAYSLHKPQKTEFFILQNMRNHLLRNKDNQAAKKLASLQDFRTSFLQRHSLYLRTACDEYKTF